MPQNPEVVIVDTKGVEHVFPAGFDPKRAAEIVRQQAAPQKPEPSSASNTMHMVAESLPSVGGIVGGIYGGVPGAAIGGAAGEGYRQLAEHGAELPGAVADIGRNVLNGEGAATVKGFAQGAKEGAINAGKEGAAQAVGQVAGNVLAMGASKLAPWLMGRATTRVTQKLMQEFPELNDTLIDKALTVSKGGYDRAMMFLKEAKGKATAALKLADASGQTIPVEVTSDLAESFKTALLEKAVKSGHVPGATAGTPLSAASKRLDPATQALFQQIDQAAKKGAALDLLPSQADLLKTQLQKESRALYANRTAPNGQKAIGMDATERAEYATQLNNAIDSLASGYKGANAEAKPLIGAVRGIKQAIRPNGNLYQAMVRPAVGLALGEEAGRQKGGTAGAIAGAATGAYATSPLGLSQEAIILAHPATAGFLRMLPKGTAQYLLGLLTSKSEQTPQAQSSK